MPSWVCKLVIFVLVPFFRNKHGNRSIYIPTETPRHARFTIIIEIEIETDDDHRPSTIDRPSSLTFQWDSFYLLRFLLYCIPLYRIYVPVPISLSDTIMKMKLVHLTTALILLGQASAFSPPRFGTRRQRTVTATATATQLAAGQGFGKENGDSGKTYGDAVDTPIRDMIDSEAAMQNFFSAREEWIPLFRSLVDDVEGVPTTTCQAAAFLGYGKYNQDAADVEIEFHETSQPWRRLRPIPDQEEDRKVLGGFLDSMHQSLVDIPVDERTDEDDDDTHFLEEGRRMLAITRFHVIRDNQGGSVESIDALFSTCWNEIMELATTSESSTGSLIVLPDYELADLKRFADMNLLRPLAWLGIHADFEISSMQRESPAIRLLYKLKAMPTEGYTPEKGFGAIEDE